MDCASRKSKNVTVTTEEGTMAFMLAEPRKHKVGNMAAADGVRAGTKSVSPAPPAMMLSPEKGFVRFCCRKVVEPRLIDVQSKSGDDIYFETVWFCSTCQRATC